MDATPHPLDPLTVPVTGIRLIEASAGTGKTWNIAALFARLVLLGVERDGVRHYPDVDRILVVTFTKAATAELKNRLRARLAGILQLLQNMAGQGMEAGDWRTQCTDDVFVRQLVEQALALEPLPRLILRLQAAVGDFDNAAIYTIHSFCQRVLRDYAFLCGVPFDTELDEGGNRERLQVGAEDFWRRSIVSDSVLSELVYRCNQTPVKQLQSVQPYLARPYLHIRQPENESGSCLADALDDLAKRWDVVRSRLPEIVEVFWRIHPRLDGNSFRTTTFAAKFDGLAGWAGRDGAVDACELWNLLKNSKGENPFQAAFVSAKVKQDQPQPTEEELGTIALIGALAEACLAVQTAEQNTLIGLQGGLLEHLRRQQAEAKQSRPERTFDDLLLDVYHALEDGAPHARLLAEAMAQQWCVALIDEFQDTDPLQYAVFRAAFADSGTPLFLVGDPKQAIYSFRGADIFAYLGAAHDAAASGSPRYTLDTNRRSHAKLINSIGALFSREQPFAMPQIDYPRVTASRAESGLNPAGAAVNIRWLNQPEDESATVELLGERAAAWCAAEIRQLLAGGSLLKGRPVCAGNVAVLVRARRDGETVQRALKKLGIRSVLLSRNSVFAEPEAEALCALLAFVIRPRSEAGLLRFVLSGCLFGQTAEMLYRLSADAQALSVWMDAADEALALWQRAGVYAAVQQFLARHGVEARLLAEGGERTLTNLHQLMELLAEEDERSHSPASLHQWLAQQIQAAKNHEDDSDSKLLRLESDEELVKIVTMHAAKGLQYPVVYCPFVWKNSNQNNQEWRIVHRGGQAVLVHKTQLDEDDGIRCAEENLSEDLRLLYVALTRAEEQLHLYLAAYSKSEGSALAYLSGADAATAKDADAYRAHWRQFVAAQSSIRAGAGAAGQEAGIDIALFDGPPATVSGSLKNDAAGLHFQAASLPTRRFSLIQHTSFTGLSRQTERAAEAIHADLTPEMDAAEQRVRPASLSENADADDIFAFAQGAAAGVCLHDVLEHFRFGETAESQRQRSAEVLQRHGFNADRWLPAVTRMLDRTRLTPLAEGISLAGIPAAAVLPEMEFLLHTEDFRLPEIRNWLARPHLKLPENIIQAARTLSFRDVHGFIKGFIDLVCQSADGRVFVIDYKSNHLGHSAQDYAAAALDDTMAEHHYCLQALIYAIATARYLQLRNALPSHICVRYLFLRGLDGESANGVWSWDIPTADLGRWL